MQITFFLPAENFRLLCDTNCNTVFHIKVCSQQDHIPAKDKPTGEV